jgi:hypothetical protein
MFSRRIAPDQRPASLSTEGMGFGCNVKPTPFDEQKDYAPTPFDRHHCDLAARLKEAGLWWWVHVGCFAWDRDGWLAESSPLPNRIYFILNLSHFARLLGGVPEISKKLIWLPTWHQARLICREHGIPDEDVAAIWSSPEPMGPGDELLALYQLLLRKLQQSR